MKFSALYDNYMSNIDLNTIEIIFEDGNTISFPLKLMLDESFLSRIFGKNKEVSPKDTLKTELKYIQQFHTKDQIQSYKKLFLSDPSLKQALYSLSNLDKESILKELNITSDNEFKDLYAQILPFKYKGGQKLEIDKPIKKVVES